MCVESVGASATELRKTRGTSRHDSNALLHKQQLHNEQIHLVDAVKPHGQGQAKGI